MAIINAKDRGITTGTLPNVQGALFDWFQPMTFKRLTKTIVAFQVRETAETYTTKGVRQPFTAQQLLMKPEGQRAWKWETLHCLPDVVLVPDDIVVFNGVSYRVKDKSDFSEYGYLKYDMVQDYE